VDVQTTKPRSFENLRRQNETVRSNDQKVELMARKIESLEPFGSLHQDAVVFG
jgi:hypothetical protein